MSSNFDDIQAAGFNTRPSMLDRTHYDSWDTLGTTPERGILLGLERPRTYDDLNDNEKKQFDVDVRATNFVLQGLRKDVYKLINHNIEAKAIWDNIKMLLAGSALTKEDRESQLYSEFECFKMLSGENINEYYVWFHKLVNDIRNIRMTMPNIQLNCKFVNNMSPEWDRRAALSDWGKTNNFDADVDDHPVRYLALNDDNIFQADECDAFDSNVNDEPTAQSIFMANLSSDGPTNQQTGTSNASILSEVHDLENAIDLCDDNQDEHKIHNEVQQKNIIDSTRDIWVIVMLLHMNNICRSMTFLLYQVASSVSNDAYVFHDNDAYVPHDPLVTELNIYKEQVSIYKQRARVKITPPNYSKENFMATFTLQTQLTPKQVFWSKEINAKKADDLKARTPPLPVLPPVTVYPPNTPVHLVPRTLPTTSQVNIGLYVITQLFWDFEKTCKEMITPTGITEGERGFEKTKRCYLTEVIPFFNLLKEHFDGVQKSLVTEVRAMKTSFENLEAEVDQNAIDLKSDSAMTASRFHELSTAYIVAMNRVVELEAENSKLLEKIKNDDHDSMVKAFPN
nr:hypothetical protein [Tanacetum cinerariifolium]